MNLLIISAPERDYSEGYNQTKSSPMVCKLSYEAQLPPSQLMLVPILELMGRAMESGNSLCLLQEGCLVAAGQAEGNSHFVALEHVFAGAPTTGIQLP